MDIEKKDLIELIDLLKSEIDGWFHEGIDFEDDFYWDIDREELYQFSKEPNDLSLGQLTEDWSELKRLKDKDQIPIKYDLQRLGVILRYLASRK